MSNTADWNTWILASNLRRVAATQRADERNADEQTTELLATIAKEWRGLVRSCGADSTERRLAYTARRIAEVRTVLRRNYMHHPACRAYDEALEAVELELGVG